MTTLTKHVLNYFFPPLPDLHPGLILLNAQEHLGDRIFATGCFKHEGTLMPEDREAMAILCRAGREVL